MAFVRVPFYFIDFLPTLLYISILLQCKFPFKYGGRFYTECATVDSANGQPWYINPEP